MNRFAALLDRLVYEPRRNAKIRLIADWLRTTPDPERGYALAALTGGLSFREAKPGLVRALIQERCDPVLFEMSYSYVGDLAETVALLWPGRERRPGGQGEVIAASGIRAISPVPARPLQGEGEITLEHVVATLSTVSKSDLPARLAEFLDGLDETGRWALLKLITGSLRIGVSARLAKTALAQLGEVAPDDVEEVWHGLEPPYEELFAWVEGRGERPVSRDPAPFRPPMLAHPLELEDFGKLDAQAFEAEWKWDGIRVQAVGGRDGARAVTRLYSRTGEDVSTAFPDLVTALAGLDAAIDGELLVVIDGRVQSFNVLQQRLNRKSDSNALMRKYPAHLRAYDLLAEGGEDLRALSFVERRARLERLVGRLDLPCLDLSAQVPFADWEALGGARADPAAHGAGADAEAVEGVMIKRCDSAYVPGRPKGLWFKWKREPFTVDAVLMYAQRGHGRRSSFYSDFTFGVWRPGEGGEELVPVGKAYFGFTDAELGELDRFVRNNTIGRFGPVREVVHDAKAGLVLEIAFEGLQRSTRHKSGLAMRFPRVSRIRWDKPIAEADRIETLEAILARGETKAHPAG